MSAKGDRAAYWKAMNLSNSQLSTTNAFRNAMGYPDNRGVWKHSVMADNYTYTYACGHAITIPATGMQAGQVAPPICPTCHASKLDQMEAENWNHNPKWAGYSVYKHEDPYRAASVGSSHVTLGSAMSWLNHELDKVYSQAWR